ncbi:hypothetical protein CRYUN_Cryun33cG0067800 [Craigia yunnanensis]
MENHKEEVKEREEEEEEVGPMAVEGAEEEEDVTSLTLERVAAAKIESHYKAQRKHFQERKERRSVLEKKLASSDVPEEEQMNLLKDLERKASYYMQLKRYKICVG